MDVKYFDNAATTSLNEDVLKKMLPYLKENYANASSIYSFAQDARCAIEDAREEIANILGANPSEIYFTSCGSESDNTAIKGIARAYKSKGNHIITSKIEHPAVLETCRSLEKEGFEISYVDVDESGIVKLDELEKLINKNTKEFKDECLKSSKEFNEAEYYYDLTLKDGYVPKINIKEFEPYFSS